MGKIVKEDGKIWFIEKHEHYGVLDIRKTLLGTYDDKPEKKKGKKTKKEDEN